MQAADWIDLSLACAIGAFVGLGELVSRYRDEPAGAAKTSPAFFYVAINAAASLGALSLVKAFGWSFGVTGEAPVRWTRILLAGFGAVGLFRSSFFVIRVGNQDVGIGPSGVLQAMLAAADREVDRLRAHARDRVVAGVMKDVCFNSGGTPLVAYCLGLMQNLSASEQAALGVQVITIRNSADTSDQTKARLLGLCLLTLVGEEVLTSAVKSLGAEIRTSGAANPPQIPSARGATPVARDEPPAAAPTALPPDVVQNPPPT